MKKAFLILASFFCLAIPVFGDEEQAIDPAALAGKTLEELYLLRNEVYARHGRLFKTNELDNYFSARKWYQRDLKYDDSRLSAADLANIEAIRPREQELLKQNYATIKMYWGV